MADVQQLDLYELLAISSSATTQQIRQAYRKKALECHPDKNPDKPHAKEMFLQLSQALEILIDESAKKAYDKVLNARKAAQVRNRELDAKRRKFKDDLEAREKASRDAMERSFNFMRKTDEEKLKAEIDRLRKEGSEQLKREQEIVRQSVLKTLQKEATFDIPEEHLPKLVVSWKAEKKDPENGGYNDKILMSRFKEYGNVFSLFLSKKQGKAFVIFKTYDSAVSAQQNEKGLESNPLTIKLLPGIRPPPRESSSYKTNLSVDPFDSEFEANVLQRLQQAAQKQKAQKTGNS